MNKMSSNWKIAITTLVILTLVGGNITLGVLFRNEIGLKQQESDKVAEILLAQEAIYPLSSDELLSVTTDTPEGLRQIIVNKPILQATTATISKSQGGNEVTGGHGLFQKHIGKWTVIQPDALQWEEIKASKVIKVIIDNKEYSLKIK